MKEINTLFCCTSSVSVDTKNNDDSFLEIYVNTLCVYCVYTALQLCGVTVMSGSQSRFRGPLVSHRGFQVIGLLTFVESDRSPGSIVATEKFAYLPPRSLAYVKQHTRGRSRMVGAPASFSVASGFKSLS